MEMTIYRFLSLLSDSRCFKSFFITYHRWEAMISDGNLFRVVEVIVY